MNMPKQEYEDLIEETNGKCGYCGCDVDGRNREIDHVIPHSRGGADEYMNYLVVCRKCNRAKHNKSIEDFKTKINRDKLYYQTIGLMKGSCYATIRHPFGGNIVTTMFVDPRDWWEFRNKKRIEDMVN